MKDEFGRKIMKKIVAPGLKIYNYITDDGHVDKKKIK